MTTTSAAARTFAVLGLLWESVVLVGLGQFVYSMTAMLVESPTSGVADSRTMAAAIGHALAPVVFWGAVGVFGFILSLITAITTAYRARWFYRSLICYAVVYLMFVPLGTITSILVAAFLVAKRREFASIGREQYGGA